MTSTKQSFSLTGFQLKYIALITMLMDHAGYMFLAYGTPEYTISRFIGRISFPVFCFLLTEGFEHTSNRKTYLLRLSLFALISELPFDMAFYHYPATVGLDVAMTHQNVFFTLALGFLAMWIMEECRFKNKFFGYFCALALAYGADWFHTDYGFGGVFLIVIIYEGRRLFGDRPSILFYLTAVLVIFSNNPVSGYGVFLACPLLYLYNGQKGSPLPGGRTFPGAQYLFYAFYPAHLLILNFLYHS